MDREMITGFVARRQSEGADAKTIYCELRNMGVDQATAMGAVSGEQQAQTNPYSAPQQNLAYGADPTLYQAAAGVKPDPPWVKVVAMIIMALCFLICWSAGILVLVVTG